MNWYHKIILAKGFTYTLPHDKRQRLYDFYMFSVLPDAKNMKDKDIYLEDGLQQIEDEVVGKLKDHLLKCVYFAVMAELRHVFMFNDSKRLIDTMQNRVDVFGGQEIMKEYMTLIQAYSDLYIEKDFPEGQDEELDKQLSRLNEDESRPDYRKSNRAMKAALDNTGLDQIDAIKMAVYLFDNSKNNTDIEWGSAYGGTMWKAIAEAWVSLYYAKEKSSIVVYIDHIYDLQHNSDTIFNKLSSYRGGPNNDYYWVKDALDHKAKITSPYELLPYVSPQMKVLAARILHQQGDADQPMSTNRYFGEHLEDIKQKWTDMAAAIPNTLSKMPEMIQNIFSDEEIADIINEMFLQGANDRRYLEEGNDYGYLSYHNWSHNVPMHMKKIFWNIKTSEELRTIFKNSFVYSPPNMDSSYHRNLCGNYNPSALYTPQEKKDMWLAYLGKKNRGSPTSRNYIHMPWQLQQLMTDEEHEQVIDYHLRDLWYDEERTEVDYTSIGQWMNYSSKMRQTLLTKHFSELVRLAKVAVNHDTKTGTSFYNSLPEEIIVAVGLTPMAQEIVDTLKTLSLDYWRHVPDSQPLIRMMRVVDQEFVDSSIDQWGVYGGGMPHAIKCLRQERDLNLNTSDDPLPRRSTRDAPSSEASEEAEVQPWMEEFLE